MYATKPYVYMCGKKIPGAKEPVVTQKQLNEAKALIAKFLSTENKK